MTNNMPYPDGRRDPYGRYDVPAPPKEPRLTIWPRRDVVSKGGNYYTCPSCGNNYVACESRTCEGGAAGQFYRKVTDEVIAKWACPYNKGDVRRHLHVCCERCKHVFALEPVKKAPSSKRASPRLGEGVMIFIMFAATMALGFLLGVAVML